MTSNRAEDSAILLPDLAWHSSFLRFKFDRKICSYFSGRAKNAAVAPVIVRQPSVSKRCGCCKRGGSGKPQVVYVNFCNGNSTANGANANAAAITDTTTTTTTSTTTASTTTATTTASTTASTTTATTTTLAPRKILHITLTPHQRIYNSQNTHCNQNYNIFFPFFEQFLAATLELVMFWRAVQLVLTFVSFKNWLIEICHAIISKANWRWNDFAWIVNTNNIWFQHFRQSASHSSKLSSIFKHNQQIIHFQYRFVMPTLDFIVCFLHAIAISNFQYNINSNFRSFYSAKLNCMLFSS